MADEEEEICRTSKAHCKRSARVSPGKVGRSDSVMLLLSIDVSSRCSICKCNRRLTLAPLADGLSGGLFRKAILSAFLLLCSHGAT